MLIRELSRFPVVGVGAVAIDYGCYRLLAAVGLGLDFAKGASFIAGALFAYIANRTFTFQATHSTATFIRFWLLYLVSLGVNVTTNALALSRLESWPLATTIAFVAATGLSMTLNFIGMKFFVFTSKAS